MKIEGIPEDWELVRIGTPQVGDNYLGGYGDVHLFDKPNHQLKNVNYVIVKRIDLPKPIDPGEGWELVGSGFCHDPKLGDQLLTADGNWVDWPAQISVLLDYDRFAYRRRIKPTYIPWTLETCPIGEVIVGPIDKVQITRCNKESCFLVSTGYVSFADMLQSFYRYNGKPCGTKVQP